MTVTGAPPSLNDLARELGEESGPGHVNPMDVENNNATDKFPDKGDNDVNDANIHADHLPRKAIVHSFLECLITHLLYSLLLKMTLYQAYKVYRSVSDSGIRRGPNFSFLVSENLGQIFILYPVPLWDPTLRNLKPATSDTSRMRTAHLRIVPGGGGGVVQGGRYCSGGREVLSREGR